MRRHCTSNTQAYIGYRKVIIMMPPEHRVTLLLSLPSSLGVSDFAGDVTVFFSGWPVRITNINSYVLSHVAADQSIAVRNK
jgi:hypothetical protein